MGRGGGGGGEGHALVIQHTYRKRVCVGGGGGHAPETGHEQRKPRHDVHREQSAAHTDIYTCIYIHNVIIYKSVLAGVMCVCVCV